MIEKTILDYLTKKLDVPVHMEIPESVPVLFVLIEKTGSALDEHIWQSTFAIQSYAGSMFEAAELCETVNAAMLEIAAEEPDITRCGINSTYNFTDTETKHYRYQSVFVITHY